MKRTIFILALSWTCVTVWTQENSITLSGGYSFANIENVDQGTSGWRINALYEFSPWGGNLSHGFSSGYVRTKATIRETSGSESEFTAGHLPIYYVPKYTFMDGKAFRPFIKGALGMHYSHYDRTGLLGGTIDTGNFGFYGGLGAGISVIFKGGIFINLEYEWVYLSNTWYKNGFLNTAMMGVGIKF